MNVLFNDLLGLPFKLHGRDNKGYDCYGLVIEVEKRLGHNMVDLDREYIDNYKQDFADNYYNIVRGSSLEKTEDREYGNIILFYDAKGRLYHIGVLLDDKNMIHCDGNGVQISNINSVTNNWEIYKWQK